MIYRDPLLRDAAKLIITHQNASASFLQRKLIIGYVRAATILDQLEFLGIVGPSNGAIPRQILITDTSQIDNLTKPRKLSDAEMQQKVLDLDLKVNKILNALQAISMDLSDDDEDNDQDNLLEEAAKLAKEKNGKLNISDVQRKLNIGYARSARILYELREEGLLGDN